MSERVSKIDRKKVFSHGHKEGEIPDWPWSVGRYKTGTFLLGWYMFAQSTINLTNQSWFPVLTSRSGHMTNCPKMVWEMSGMKTRSGEKCKQQGKPSLRHGHQGPPLPLERRTSELTSKTMAFTHAKTKHRCLSGVYGVEGLR